MSVLIRAASFYQSLDDEEIEDLEYIEVTAKMLGYDIVADSMNDWVLFKKDDNLVFDVYFGNNDFSVVIGDEKNNLNEVMKKYKHEFLTANVWFEHLRWNELVDICKTLL
ncbi:hypothetical protein D3C76_796460 [compost metagenome]